MTCPTEPLTEAMLGTGRAIDPPGALPHIARRIDPTIPANEFELELDVEMVVVDATSYREIRQRCDADPARMARTISAIVAEYGKLQNPWTGSGGILMGTVSKVGSLYRVSEVEAGDRVVPLASLIAIPLSLHSVGPVNPATSVIPARGRAIVTGRMLCAALPADLPVAVALGALDVYPVASYVRELTAARDHVLVLGAGHAGLLAIAAAREALGDGGAITAVDVSHVALARALQVAPQVQAVAADVTDPVTVVAELSRRDLPPADLTLLCTSVPGGEGTALLAASERGTVLFFSTATQFAAAALGADAIGSQARLIIPNGLTDDRGEYALELLRRSAPLRAAFVTHA